MSDGDVFMSQTNASPQAARCISQGALNKPLRGTCPDADLSECWSGCRTGAKAIYICRHSVFNDRAPQNTLVVATLFLIHRLLLGSFTSGKKLLKTG